MALRYYIDRNFEALNIESALSLVSPERREKAMRYYNDMDKRASLSVFLLLRKALKKEFGIEEMPIFTYGKYGKPYLKNHPEVCFSMSHCKAATACVVANENVGIDIESIVPIDCKVMAMVLSDTELREVETANDSAVAFAKLWTRKEAVAKLLGVGIDEQKIKEILQTTNGIKEMRFKYEKDDDKRFVCCVVSRNNGINRL